jgi:peptide chain release factor 1
MYDKLKFIEEKYDELSNTISDPEVIADQNRWRELMKEHSNLEPIVAKFKEYRDALTGIDDSREMLQVEDDKDFVDMIKAELSDLEEKKTVMEEELKIMLLPQDPNDEKNVIVEIRGGCRR